MVSSQDVSCKASLHVAAACCIVISLVFFNIKHLLWIYDAEKTVLACSSQNFKRTKEIMQLCFIDFNFHLSSTNN